MTEVLIANDESPVNVEYDCEIVGSLVVSLSTGVVVNGVAVKTELSTLALRPFVSSSICNRMVLSTRTICRAVCRDEVGPLALNISDSKNFY